MSNPKPTCSKCGYDQSGEVATWKDQCPMEGICPECGHGFAWAEVMDSARYDMDWYVEHAKKMYLMIPRSLSTVGMLIIPNRYWYRVGSHSPVRLGWLMIWLVFLFLGVHLLTSGVVMENQIVSFRSSWGSSTLITSREWIEIGVDSLFLPLNSAEWQSADYFHGSSAYQSIYGFNSWYEIKYPIDFGVTGTVRSLTLIGASATWMVLLVALPKTRRMHGVQIIHIARAFALTIFAASLLFELGRFLDAVIEILYIKRSLFWGDFLRYDADVLIFGVPSIVLLIWVQWFWATAIGTGWKIRSSWILGMAGVCASLLGGFWTYIVVVFF